MPASIKAGKPRDCGCPQAGRYALHGSFTPPHKAGFLALGSSPLFPFSCLAQWVSEKPLLHYSDRIAQDFHLIPFSAGPFRQHFVCSIWNYTDIILSCSRLAVNAAKTFPKNISKKLLPGFPGSSSFLFSF